jgi:DNA polymerase zeta
MIMVLLGLDISDLISRAPPRYSGGGPDQWGMRKSSTLKVAGRHVLNSWRIMRSEKTLTMYTFENVVFEVLRRRFIKHLKFTGTDTKYNYRVPKYSYKTLTKWYSSPVTAHASLLLRYLFMRVVTTLELLEETEIVTKTA